MKFLKNSYLFWQQTIISFFNEIKGVTQNLNFLLIQKSKKMKQSKTDSFVPSKGLVIFSNPLYYPHSYSIKSQLLL
jgi:hypothetical protein